MTERKIKTAARSKPAKEKTAKTVKPEKYFRGLGRRKSATAIAKLYQGGGEIVFNGRSLADYFTVLEFQQIVQESLKAVDQLGRLRVEISSKGGGMRGQAEAARLAIARALVKLNNDFKNPLRALGLLTRDARVKERKKPGLKKARRAPQWRKR